MTGLVDVAGLSARDLAAWRELADTAAEPNPYLDPDFVLPAVRALRHGPVRLLVAGDWTAALPVVARPARRDVVLPGLCSWRHPYTFLGTPLVVTGAVEEGVQGLLDGGRRAARAYVAFDRVMSDGPVGIALEQRAGPGTVATERFERAVVLRRDAPTYLDGRLSSQRRKKLRRQARTLATAAQGELEVVDLARSSQAVETFLRLELAGWKGRAGTAMAANPAHAQFLRELCEGFARRDALQLLALRVGERVVAMQCNLRAGAGFFCFKVAYDEEFASLSPGTQLEIKALDVFHDRTDAAWMDSCASSQADLINRLWPDRRTVATLLVPSGPALGRVLPAAAHGTATARAARRRARRALADLRTAAPDATRRRSGRRAPA